MKKRQKSILMAAVAGITMGLRAPVPVMADEKKDEVKCWGVDSCGQNAKCAVTDADLKALQALLGEKEYKDKFGKSETHSCGSHAKCGPSDKIINWMPTSAAECKAKGGYLIDEVGADKKKVAKKA